MGYIRLVKAVVPHQKNQGDGRIVNIISGAGRTPRSSFLTEYEGETLRENLGLTRPVNQFSKITSPELASAAT